MIMRDHVTYSKEARFTPMTKNLDKFVTYGKMNALMKSHVPLTTYSCEVTQQTQSEIFLPPEDASSPNLARY